MQVLKSEKIASGGVHICVVPSESHRPEILAPSKPLLPRGGGFITQSERTLSCDGIVTDSSWRGLLGRTLWETK